MPKGFESAKKVGGRRTGYGFMPRPRGINYFRLKLDGESAVIRFLDNHDEISWVRQWRLPPSANFQYGEYVNAVDQYEDGTPDPGYAANLRASVRAYPIVIWRNAPVYQRDNDGKLVTGSNGERIIMGYQDQLAVWEISYRTYEMLGELDKKQRASSRQAGPEVGLPFVDFEVTRKGRGTDTQYVFYPEGVPGQMSTQDQQLVAQFKQQYVQAVEQLTKVPTYDQLAKYINEGVPYQDQRAQSQEDNNVTQMVSNNAIGLDGVNPFLNVA